MPKIIIQPSGQSIEVSEDENLLEALRAQNVYVKSSCGGHASCSDCIIKILSGMDNLNKPPFEETQLLGNVSHITKERLSCQSYASGDIEIDLSMHDQMNDQKKLLQKTASVYKKNLKVRKKEDVDKMYQERRDKRRERDAEDPNRKYGKPGGNQRPRPFHKKKKS